jgi:hypothetical protein
MQFSQRHYGLFLSQRKGKCLSLDLELPQNWKIPDSTFWPTVELLRSNSKPCEKGLTDNTKVPRIASLSLSFSLPS